MLSVPARRHIDHPVIWLCQNLRNRVLCSEYDALKNAPILISVGDAFLRPTFFDRFFHENLRETLGMCGPIMIDSGGFALLSRNRRFDIRKLEAVYTRIPGEILVSLDYPPSPCDDYKTKARYRSQTARNLARLACCVSHQRLMPVVHGHDVAELRTSCDLICEIMPSPTQIGVGGLVPLMCSGGSIRGFHYKRTDGTMGDRADWIADALEIVRNRFPRAMLHVFGIGSATTAIAVLALGADSVDSLAWRRSASFGAILLPGKSERFPTFKEGRLPSRPVLQEEDLQLLQSCLCPICIRHDKITGRRRALAGCYKRRAVHNAWTLLAEVAGFRAALRSGNVSAFLSSRVGERHRLFRPVSRMLQMNDSAAHQKELRGANLATKQ